MDKNDDLHQQAAHFVHHLSTPAATLQLNLQVLQRYLPTLVTHYKNGNSTGDDPRIPGDMLTALQDLTAPMQESVAVIQQRTREFAKQLQQQTQAQPAVAQTERATRRIRKVLMVEDEEIHQQVALLQLAGRCHVDLASNGREALLKWQNTDYDLLLMDFLLPGMSGLQLLEALAELPRPAPLVIAFTNLPESAKEFSATAIPIAANLSKPFKLSSFEALLARLNLALGAETQR